MKDKKIVIIDSELYTAWCHPRQRLIHHQWHKYCTGNGFRNALTKALEAFENFRCNKWLSDDRDFAGALDPEDWKWGETHFTDRAVKAGWKYSAMVMPAKGLAKISFSALINYFAAKGVETQIFTELEKAQEWIRQK